MRFATVLRESGTDGNGGALEDMGVVVLCVVLLFDPVSPTEALVAPPLVSHGFGGDGDDMLPCVPLRRFYAQSELLQSEEGGVCRQREDRRMSRDCRAIAGGDSMEATSCGEPDAGPDRSH